MNRLVLVLPALLCASGCTIVLDPGEVQCETAQDCETRGFAGAECTDNVCVKGDPVWGCLGHVTEPVPDKTKTVDFSIRLVFASDKGPVTMATIDICDKLDIDCAVMSPDVPKGLSPDVDGNVSLSAKQGFDGFLRIKGPDVMDSLVFVGRPIVAPPTVKEVRLVRPGEYSAIATLAGEQVDPARGSSILLAVSCEALPGSGVRFESPSADAKSKLFYLVNQLPTPPPQANKTDVDGFGGFLNMPVGANLAKSFRADNDAYIGESSFRILANTLRTFKSPPPLNDTMKAERVGKYHLIALLGQGGMASVYLSLVPGPLGVNKLLVVKVLREDLSQDTDFLAMFLNEARLAARLNHANVVQTYEIGSADGRHFLAMDYLDGQPLNSLLRKASRKGMPLDIHLRILSDMLAGLHYAHTLTDFDGTHFHVVHRDVSPQNVFVTYDGHVKVVDFGIAKAAGAASTTQSGTFKGKLAYAAPEQAGGDAIDARADVFSAGVMLWEAIAKRRFAPADDQAAMLGRRLTGNEPKIRDAVPNVDPELADICDRALALRPEDRFPSAQALREALEGTLQRWNRHIGPQDVGQLVSELFVEERQKIRLVIDEQMKRLLRETDTTLPMPVIEAFPALRDPTPITTIEGVAAFTKRGPSGPADTWSQKSQGTLAAANLSPAAPPAQPKTRALMVGIAVFAVVLAGGLGVFFVTRRAPAPPAAAPSDSAGDAAQIRLSITFGPPGAVAKLDGVTLSESPFVAHVKRDGSMHRIDVEGPGLTPETRMVSYVKDVAVELSLKAAEPAAATAEPYVPTPPSAAPSDTGKRPPGDGKAPPKKPLGIDEQDPYKK